MQHISYTSSVRPALAGWKGGKSLLAKRIIERIPKHTGYVEPFAGAAWVLFRKGTSKVEILNDINKDIVNLYRVVRCHLEELIRFYNWSIVSRDEFIRLKNENPESLTDIQRAARFLYLQQTSYGGQICNPTFSCSVERAPKFDPLRVKERLSAVRSRLSRVYVECLPYAKCIRRYDRPETFFYIDPPYWNHESDYGKDIFSREDFIILAELLASIQGKFLLSLNDTREVRDIFSAFAIEVVQTRYVCSETRVTAGELFITNY